MKLKPVRALKHKRIPALRDSTVFVGMGVAMRTKPGRAPKLYERIGPLPDWRDHRDMADGVNEWLDYETPYSADMRLVGEPYGDDWTYARRISQFYLAHPIRAALYIHYVR
jgi:hypothetical protein